MSRQLIPEKEKEKFQAPSFKQQATLDNW